MAVPTTSPTSMRTFFVVWVGQLISVTGTGITGFGLGIWVFVETGSVTDLALISLALALPATVISPFAGALVDRWDRRKIMLFSDVTAGLATLLIAALYITDSLALWHIFLLVGVGSVANSFQSPAWLAAIPLLVPKPQLGRANGLVQLNDALSIVLAPAMAGALLLWFGLGGVLIVDAATFLIAVGTLAVVGFPRQEIHEETSTGTVRGDVVAGWRWLRERPGLFGLLWVYGAVNFALSFANVLFIPLVASFASEAAAGSVLSIAGIGAVAGSVAVSAWGGPERRVRGTMIAIAVAGVAIVVAGLEESVVVVAVAAFFVLGVVPVANTASQVLWHTKTPPGVQGRVFSVRRTISQAIAPVAILAAGPLADSVFEPLMATDGALASSVGSIIGTGPGRGVGLMFLVAGTLTALIAVIGYALPRIRNIETELPDHETEPERAAP